MMGCKSFPGGSTNGLCILTQIEFKRDNFRLLYAEKLKIMSKPHPKHIVIIVENLPVPFDRRVWLEASTLRDAGYKVSVICPKMMNYTKSYEELEGIRIYRYRVYEAKSGIFSYLMEFVYCWCRTFLKVLRIRLRERIDIIHGCNPPDTFWLIGRIFKPFGVRFIFDEHDLCPEVYLSKKDDFKQDAIYRILIWLQKMTYKTADVVISTNESYRKIAQERGGVPADRLFVVRSGPDLKRLKSTTPREELKRGKPHLICYLGTMGPQDGVDYLLKSIAHLKYQLKRDDFHVAIIGGGIMFEELKKLAQQLHLEDVVTFTGRIADAEVMQYLSTADVCVCPDPKNPLNDVSTMNKTLEYMVFGKPIVAFDLTETRYSAGDSALYAQPNEVADFASKIVTLLDNVELRQRMGKIGQERIKQHLAWEHSIPHLLAAYKKALGLNDRNEGN